MNEKGRPTPKVSVIIVVYDMPHQALRTLESFALPYQREVSRQDYEIIVVENRSDRLLGEAAATSVAANVRYFLRENEGQSPVPALIFGIGKARAPHLGLVIDGARMVTPRVLRYALDAFLITPDAVVNVPGYHIGETEQHLNPSHDEAIESRLLQRIDWRQDGYRLFTISTFFRGRHHRGYLLPLMESNCLFFSRSALEAVGGVDERFDMPGGGMVNLDLYKELGERPGAALFLLPGEGTFHQYHGGVTTRVDERREELLHSFREQYLQLRGKPYGFLMTKPRLLGAVTGWAMPMLEQSAAESMWMELQ